MKRNLIVAIVFLWLVALFMSVGDFAFGQSEDDTLIKCDSRGATYGWTLEAVEGSDGKLRNRRVSPVELETTCAVVGLEARLDRIEILLSCITANLSMSGCRKILEDLR